MDGEEVGIVMDPASCPAETVSVTGSPDRRRRLVIVTRKLDVGGTERHLLQLLPRLNQSRFDVCVHVLRSGGRLEREFEMAGVPIVHAPLGLSGWMGIVGAAGKLLARMATQRRTIFHFFLPEAYTVGGLCGVLAFHPNLIMSRRSLNCYQAAHPFVARLERILHNAMRFLLGNSRAVLDELADEGVPESRLALVYNGIEAAQFCASQSSTDTRREIGLDTDSLVFTCVANMFPYKGHADLLAAFGMARESLPRRWHLLCVGRDVGLLRSLQIQAEQEGIGGHIRFLGERDDVVDLLNASNIGLLCSHEEGFSNSILEGMAAGLPMIVTDVGGNAEAVMDGETGLVVPPRDPASLARAILDLASAPDKCRRMGEAGKRRVETVFSWESCLKGYERIYGMLLNDRLRPPL